MDKRSEPRISHHIRFFVHVSACDQDPDLVGVSLTCEGVDFSTQGLQFRTEDKIPIGTLLNITIGIGQPFSMFLLSGRVRWIREIDKQYYLGIRLIDDPDTDLGTWGIRFEELFS